MFEILSHMFSVVPCFFLSGQETSIAFVRKLIAETRKSQVLMDCIDNTRSSFLLLKPR